MEHVSILLASAAALPRRESLEAYLHDVAQAESRGYFTPEEDERLREVYGRYLAIRASLLQCLESLSQGRWSHRHTDDLRAFVVLRPRMHESEVARAVENALSHAGKLYDFIFDFTCADRLACTELVYRSYHSVGSVHLELQSRAGRHCLSAEDLLNQLIGQGWFEPVLLYGLDGNAWQEGPTVRERLRRSFDASFGLKEK